MDKTDRQRLLTTVGIGTAFSLTGCLMDDSGNSGNGNRPNQQNGIQTWSQRINDYVDQASIAWEQFSGRRLRMGMNSYLFTDVTQSFVPNFTDLADIGIMDGEKFKTNYRKQLRTQLRSAKITLKSRKDSDMVITDYASRHANR